MAKREEEGLLDLMVELPWWVSIIVGAIAYVGFRYVLPAIPIGDAISGVFVKVLFTLAPLIALMFVLTAFVSAVRGGLRRRRSANELAARQAQGIGRCPKCGSELVLRTAKKGANAGDQFWGCASFPKCRHIEPYRG